MTCIRPDCTRSRDIGVHCRKCHRRFKTQQHNARHAAGPDPYAYPCYAPDASARMVEGTLDALLVSTR